MSDQTWKKTVAARIRAMTPEQARASLASITADTSKNGATILHAEIRNLTGGFNSQSINFHVIRMLGKKAGICR